MATRLPGKPFDEWMVPVNDTKRLPVKIRAQQRMSLTSYTYYGYCDDPKMDWKADTLVDLRKQIEEDFKEHFALTFKPTLIVLVDSGWESNDADRYPKGLLSPEVKWDSKSYEMIATDKPMLDDVSATLKVSIEPCYLADTGEIQHGTGVGKKYGAKIYQKRDTHEDRDSHSWQMEDDDKYSLIPDTPENREALQQIVDGVHKLRSKLEDLLSQKKIGSTIKMINANGMKLLPAKDEKE